MQSESQVLGAYFFRPSKATVGHKETESILMG